MSGSALNVGFRTTLKRKPNVKDDRPLKKGTGPLIGEQQQKAPLPLPPPRHGAMKGLMAWKIPITHKDYIVKMVTLIIKEMDLDLYGEHTSKDLGASGLYDLSRVCPLHLYCTSIIFLLLILTICFLLGVGAYEGP